MGRPSHRDHAEPRPTTGLRARRSRRTWPDQVGARASQRGAGAAVEESAKAPWGLSALRSPSAARTTPWRGEAGDEHEARCYDAPS